MKTRLLISSPSVFDKNHHLNQGEQETEERQHSQPQHCFSLSVHARELLV